MRSSPGTAKFTRALTVAVAILLLPVAWAGSRCKVLHNFGAGNDGAFPSGTLLLGMKGRLYGVTGGGPGHYGYGVAFELMPHANGKWKEAILHAFASGSDGADPVGALTFDGAGNLYGTTNRYGGASPSTAFELSPASKGWSHTVLYDNGAGPGLVLDKAGNLYGNIGPGDYFGAGAIGELSAGSNGWTYTQLYSFCSQSRCADGRYPVDPPIWDTHGNLYGTTYYGGIGQQPKCWDALGCGVVFQMIHQRDGTWIYHVLHRFASFPHDGQSPAAGLVRDASGSLYGNTVYGGTYNQGTIFKFTRSGGRWKQTVLYDFPNCANGCFPGGTLVFDKAGNLYGAASGGLADCQGYACGLVFKLAPQAGGKWKYGVVHKFDGKDGASPWGVIVDGKGNIFGTTENGGTYNAGVVFEITP